MTRTGEQRLLDALIDAPAGTLKAAELSARLRVSTRSVRTYVVAVRRRYGDIVATTRDGYRLDVSAYLGACGSVRDDADGRGAPMTPVERIAWLARTIIAGTSPCDLHALAEAAHVSDSTIESDLVKTRAILAELDVHLVRDRSTISARGTEIALRRAVRRFLVDDVAARTRIADGIATTWADPSARMLREGLHAALESAGLGVNDASAEVLLTHIAVMADRVRQGHTVVSVPHVRDSPALERARESLTALVEDLFDVTLPRSEIHYLGFLLAENAIPDRVDMLDDHSAPFVDPKYLALVRTIVDRVLDVYDIDLSGDRFVAFLAMHVQHLSDRARASDSRTVAPGLSIRHTHPLVYEIAVFVAQQLEQELDLRIVEAEISLLSFHVGARFQGLHERERRVSVAVVAPRYYDVHRSLSRAVDDAIKGFGKVDIVVTDLATDWDRLSVDAVVTTVAIATSGVPVLRVGVIPTAADLESLSDAIREIARRKLRSRIAADLVEMFDPALFSRGEAGLDSDAMLAHLAGRLADQGYVGPGFIEDVRERERMSPTSFSSGAAIPHALLMNATRAGIAVHVSDSPVPWAGEEVRLVAMFAFTRAQRETMGPLFEGFIHALANADTVRTLVQEATSYEGFIQGLLRVL